MTHLIALLVTLLRITLLWVSLHVIGLLLGLLLIRWLRVTPLIATVVRRIAVVSRITIVTMVLMMMLAESAT